MCTTPKWRGAALARFVGSRDICSNAGAAEKHSMQAAPANCPAFCFYRSTVCWTRLNEYRTRCRAAERWVVLGSRPLSHSLVAPALKGIPRGPVKRAKAAPLQVSLLFFLRSFAAIPGFPNVGPIPRQRKALQYSERFQLRNIRDPFLRERDPD